MSKRIQFAARLLAITAILGFAGSSVAQAGPDDPPGLERAHAAVKNDARLILNFAYPTAKRLNDVDYVEGTKYADGSFRLTYKLSYTDSDGDPAWVRVNCDFTSAGKLTQIRGAGTSSFWPAFGTAKLFLELTKEGIRNDPNLRNDPNWKPLLDVNEPTEFLVEVIKLKNLR